MPRAAATPAGGGHPAAELGLPADGPGSVAPMGRRVVAFGLDALSGVLIGGLVVVFLGDVEPLQRALVNNACFAAQVMVLQALTGQSLGMRALGVRVHRPSSAGGVPGFGPAAVRTALLMLLLPAVVLDRAGRGLHDRAAGTVVVRA